MNDMIEILQHLHQYVPNARSEEEVMEVNLRDDTSANMRPIPVGGDQLTCERIRGARKARADGDTPEERLEGLFCMVEDFHEKMIFLQIIMDKYFKAESCRESGTLYQLKNLLNRRNVSKDVASNYHAVCEFVDLVVECHVIEACLVFCDMDGVDSPCRKIKDGIRVVDNISKKKTLFHLVGEIVDRFFLNTITLNVDRLEGDFEGEDMAVNSDMIYNYATNLTKLGLLRKVAVLSTRYGDGHRLLRHWKYALLLYHEAHKIKYRLESFLVLAGVNALFTPRQRHQVIHNRFVNLSGGGGNNLDGDYVMELLNRYAKSRVKLLGPNHSEETVNRIGKTMMFCHDIESRLQKQIGVAPTSRYHKIQNLTRDRATILRQLRAADVLKHIPGRVHAMENVDIFSNIVVQELHSNIDVQELHKWIRQKNIEYSNRKSAF